MGETKIRWTSATWNPVTGCSHVSDGCTHCYAETLSLRFGWSKKPWKAQFAKENVRLRPERLGQPYHWKTPRRIFVNSMSDLFHELVPFEFVNRVFAVMEETPQHTYQILTKRPLRMREYLLRRWIERDDAGDYAHRDLANVWVGTSVEDQRRADERIPILLGTPAAVRFLSCEPLLAPLNLRPYLDGDTARCETCFDEPWDYECGCACHSIQGLHWVIVGGESGPGYRPMDKDWARAIRDQCEEAGVAYFYKQSAGPRTEMDPYLDGQRYEQYPETMLAEAQTVLL